MKSWDSNAEIANTGAQQTSSASSSSMSASLPESSSVSLWSATTSCSGTPPGLSLPISTKIFSSGVHGRWWKWRNEFRQNLQLSQCLLQINWSPHAGSKFCQTFHGVPRLDNQLVDLHALFINNLLVLILMSLTASIEVNMIFEGFVEERNWKLPHSKTLLSLTCVHTNTIKFYSVLFNFIEFTIQYGNCNEIHSWKENYGEFEYLFRHLTKYSWWSHQPSSTSKNLLFWFEIILATGQLMNVWLLWFLCGTIAEEQSASKLEKKIDHGNIFS